MHACSLAAALLVACTSPPPVQPVQHRVAPEQPVRQLEPPTLATAGAATCRLLPPIALGRHGSDVPVLGFDGTRGLAARITEHAVLEIVPIARDGHVLGTPVRLAMPSAKARPLAITSLGDRAGRFALLLYEMDGKTELHWRVVVDREGHGSAAEREFVDSAPPEPARKAGMAYEIINAATPPPPGPGGRIYEAAGRPMFVRTLDGHDVGERLELEIGGTPVSHGMYVNFSIAWSGTHFIYPFWSSADEDSYVDMLLPIDCRR